MAPEAYVEVNPADAERLGITFGERVRVVSRRGAILVPARITDTVMPGAVFVPFHFGGLQQHEAANELTAGCVGSGIEAAAVQERRLPFGTNRQDTAPL